MIYAIDHIQDILDFAYQNIKKGNSSLLKRISFIKMDGRKGKFDKAPYNIIHVGGAIPSIPKELEEQLAIGGVIWAPVGEKGGNQNITVIEKDKNGIIRTQQIMAVSYSSLGKPEDQLF